MVRKRIPPEVQARILSESRRRCAVCFGLHGDLRIKKGQIAHLDKDPANAQESNLIFLCFDHHDEFDSTTSQAKGLTRLEILSYQDQLTNELTGQWERGEFDVRPNPINVSLVVNVSNTGGAGGAGGAFAGGGGGGGAPMGGGGSGGKAPNLPNGEPKV